MYKINRIKGVKRKAYEGISGIRRKQFCDEYRRVLPQIYSKFHDSFVKTLKEGEQISCKEGCLYCCYQHISVSLAHGIVIVDYLYSHDAVLDNFLSNYRQWNEYAGDISRKLDAGFNLAIQDGDPSAIPRHSNDPHSSSYFDIQVRCPLLLNSSCSIYEVRPLNCAAHYSVSPSEWCSKDSPEKPIIKEVLPGMSDMNKLWLLPSATPSLFLHHSTMPILVYELLVYGLPAFLRKGRIDGGFM